MGVGDYGGRPVGHDQPGQLRRGQQRALQVHVRVDQARQDGPARQRNRVMRRPELGPDAGDPAVSDDDLRRFDPLGEDVDDLPAGQEQVGGLQAPGHADAPLEQVQVARGGGMVGWWMRLRVAVHGGLRYGPSDLNSSPLGPRAKGAAPWVLEPPALAPEWAPADLGPPQRVAGPPGAELAARAETVEIGVGDRIIPRLVVWSTLARMAVRAGRSAREPAATSSGADSSDMDVVSHPLEPGRCAERPIIDAYRKLGDSTTREYT